MLKELTDVHLDWVGASRAPTTYEIRERHLLTFLRYAGKRPTSEIAQLTLAGFHGWVKKRRSNVDHPKAMAANA